MSMSMSMLAPGNSPFGRRVNLKLRKPFRVPLCLNCGFKPFSSKRKYGRVESKQPCRSGFDRFHDTTCHDARRLKARADSSTAPKSDTGVPLAMTMTPRLAVRSSHSANRGEFPQRLEESNAPSESLPLLSSLRCHEVPYLLRSADYPDPGVHQGQPHDIFVRRSQSHRPRES